MQFFRYIVHHSGSARGLLVGAVILGAVGGGTTVWLLALINRALGSDAAAGALGALFASLCVLLIVARVTSQYLLARLGHGMVRDVRLRLCRSVLSTPLARLEQLGSHRVLATLTEDVNAITTGFMYAPVVVLNGAMMVGGLGYLAWLDRRLFLLLLVALVVGIGSYQIPARLGLGRFRAAREQQDTLFGHLRELLGGLKELKLHRGRRAAFGALLAAAAEATRRLRVRAAVIYNTAAAWGALLFFVVVGLLLFARPPAFDVGRDVLTGYTLVLLYLMGPLQVFLDSFAVLGQADVAVTKVERLGLSLEPEPRRPSARSPAAGSAGGSGEDGAPQRWRRLELRGVTHAYRRDGREDDFTLGPFHLAFEPGEVVFMVGGNGSGKTTLAKLILGLYEPEGGEIRLDGRVIAGEPAREDYRQLFSAVFADFFVFDSLLGLDAPDLDRRAGRYLARLCLDHKVEVEDGRLSATELSQGQRKRLALLTAYLEDRPIYLFDEWAADQDPVFKEVFYRAVLPELKERGKAVLAITHDDRYFGLADRILKLEDGRLVYEGPPAGLVTEVGAGVTLGRDDAEPASVAG